MSFGERLRKLRTARGLKQEELAEAMGITRQTFSRWESDLFEPRLSDLLALAKILNVTLDELATGEKPRTLEVSHGPLTLRLPADEEGYAFLEGKLREMTEKKSAAPSSKAG